MPLAHYEPCTSVDYWNLPDGQRAELIDGDLYGMAPPSFAHQELVLALVSEIRAHIKKRGGPCRVVVAPFAVNLKADDSTWVEPDVSVVCDASKITQRGCNGAPDLVIEVASPSSRRMDYLTKAMLYQQSGVREYWIVDPDAAKTTVYSYAAADFAPQQHPFGEAVSMEIFDDLTLTVAELIG